MRIAFINTLFQRAKKDKDIILLTADLGFSVFEQFIKELPGQYINMGVAEQNMTGVAAGLAAEGKKPFIYSIVPFVTMRNFEHIRNDICYQNLNVKIVGVGAGFSYGPYGHTHHGLEDIGIMRTLAGLTIFSPGDPLEAKFVTTAAMGIQGPVYIRLGKAGEPIVHNEKLNLHVGKIAELIQGKDFTILATGSLLKSAVEVARIFQKEGKTVTLGSVHTIKPLDKEFILSSAQKTKAIITIEEHSVIGGLGSAVAEVLAEKNINVKFKRIGVEDKFTKTIGTQEHMRKANNLSPDQIIKTILTVLNS